MARRGMFDIGYESIPGTAGGGRPNEISFDVAPYGGFGQVTAAGAELAPMSSDKVDPIWLLKSGLNNPDVVIPKPSVKQPDVGAIWWQKNNMNIRIGDRAPERLLVIANKLRSLGFFAGEPRTPQVFDVGFAAVIDTYRWMVGLPQTDPVVIDCLTYYSINQAAWLRCSGKMKPFYPMADPYQQFCLSTQKAPDASAAIKADADPTKNVQGGVPVRGGVGTDGSLMSANDRNAAIKKDATNVTGRSVASVAGDAQTPLRPQITTPAGKTENAAVPKEDPAKIKKSEEAKVSLGLWAALIGGALLIAKATGK